MPSLNVHQIVTERFIDALNRNIIPWRKTWKVREGQWPINRSSKKPYRGVNVFLLMITSAIEGYTHNQWLTYKQATELGGCVKKGAKGTQVVFWKVSKYEKENESGDKESRKGFLLRYYTVFNVAQCEGIEPIAKDEWEPVSVFQACALADHTIEHWNGRPAIVHRGSQPCYRVLTDEVIMPERTDFTSSEEYYSTLFHELVHSTGAKKRLDRDLTGSRMTDRYAKEELIAEIGAAMLSFTCGLDTPELFDNSVAYVQGWISKLKQDDKLILSAAGAAQKAVDMICGTTFEKAMTEDEVVEQAA